MISTGNIINRINDCCARVHAQIQGDASLCLEFISFSHHHVLAETYKTISI